ncbi:MAG: hypothetical protein IPP71_20575 [Bacteroidetes bacterium]|nr:hypothetical protein [Bacteroidota bacterium]
MNFTLRRSYDSLYQEKFYIQNPITIGSSETLTFTGCDLVFAPGVEITVDDGGELTINLASTIPITPSHLFSCDEMWQGITVNPGGVFNFNGSLSGNDDNLCKIEMQKLPLMQSKWIRVTESQYIFKSRHL